MKLHNGMSLDEISFHRLIFLSLFLSLMWFLPPRFCHSSELPWCAGLPAQGSLRHALSQHSLISERLMVQSHNILYTVLFLFFFFCFLGVELHKPGGSCTSCCKMGCKMSCYVKSRKQWFACLFFLLIMSILHYEAFCSDETHPSQNKHIPVYLHVSWKHRRCIKAECSVQWGRDHLWPSSSLPGLCVLTVHTSTGCSSVSGMLLSITAGSCWWQVAWGALAV